MGDFGIQSVGMKMGINVNVVKIGGKDVNNPHPKG
jgi:rRNA maturation endonuclease Nob1